MHDLQSLPTGVLLRRFSDFHARVVHFRSLQSAGTLADDLADGGAPVTAPDAQARAIHARLVAELFEQGRLVRLEGPQALVRFHANAAYAMAALVDEIFVLEQRWPGQACWLDTLIEQRLFGTRLAGRVFYERLESVLACGWEPALARELAACFLMAIRLGFKGIHRGAQGAPALSACRARLARFIGVAGDAAARGPVFAQAYEHTCTGGGEPARVHGPWRTILLGGAGSLLLLSSLLWLWLAHPLLALPLGAAR